MIKKNRNIRRFFALILSLIFIFYSEGLQVLAASVQNELVTDSIRSDEDAMDGTVSGSLISRGNVSDGDVTNGDVSGGDVTNGDVSDGDVTSGDVSDGDVKSGDVSDGDVTSGDVSDGDVTSGDVSGGDVTNGDVTGGDVSGADISNGDASPGDVSGDDSIAGTNHLLSDRIIVASGFYYGMAWTVYDDGMLLVTGEYEDKQEGRSWRTYSSIITSAKVTAQNVTSTSEWFSGLSSLKKVDLSEMDGGKVKDASYMFFGCSELTTILFGNHQYYNITDISYMFCGCESLERLTLENLHTEKVTNMRYLFANCKKLSKIPVSHFDTSKVKDMTSMFQDCLNATSIDVSNFDTANVTSMTSMFSNCNSVQKLNVSGFATEKVVTFTGMFRNCHVLSKLDLRNFKTYSAKYFDTMFSGCYAISSLDLSSFNTDSAISMQNMFGECHSLKNISLGSFRTTSVTEMNGMFYRCYSLETLDLSNFNMRNVKSADAMLGWCGALKELKCPTELYVNVDLPIVMQNESGEQYTLLPLGTDKTIALKCLMFEVSEIDDVVFTGEGITPEVKVFKGDELLVCGTDYKISYRNNKFAANASDAKAPTVVIKGINRFQGTLMQTFSILPKRMDQSEIVVCDDIFPYSGKVQKHKPGIIVDGIKLKAGKDVVISFPDATEGAYKDPGIYEVVFTGKGNYTGTYRGSIRILSKDQIQAKDLKIERIAAQLFQNIAMTPTPKVSYRGKVLEKDVDYSFSYENNRSVGTATLIVNGLENENGTYVTGSVRIPFRITGTPLNKTVISYKNEMLFTGNALYPEVKITYNGKALRENYDYRLVYENNTDVGKGKITISGTGAFTGTIRKTFRINPDLGMADLMGLRLADADGIIPYCKGGAKPKVVALVGRTTLVENVDYTLSYKNNNCIAASDSKRPPTVIVRGKGNYRFRKTLTFSVTSQSINDEDISIQVNDVCNKHKDLRSKPTLFDSNGQKLVLNKDYKIVGYNIGGVPYDPKNIPKDATRGIVTIRGIGCYGGERSIMYRITPKSIHDADILCEAVEYRGEPVLFDSILINYGALKISDHETGKELSLNKDYEIISYTNNNRIGTASMTIKGCGDYSGCKVVKFRIIKQSFN